MPHRPRERAQIQALAEAFFTRFFESDTTVERTDPTRSFLWLVAMLSAPGLLLSFYSQFSWDLLARFGNAEALRLAARFDASLYLALTFAAVAVLAATRWQSLLIDRRDALVLGVLPLRPRAIVAAKLAALAAYIGLIAVAAHVASSVVYGISLGPHLEPGGVFRTFIAHLLAGSGLVVFVMTAVAAVQAIGLAVIGPSRFQRTSVVMQMIVVGLVLTVFTAMPGKGTLAFSTFDPDGVVGPPWVWWLPPLWFLGVFETLVGTATEDMRALATIAGIALAGSTALLALAAPVAGWRTLRSTLGAAAPARDSLSRHTASLLTRALSRVPAVRGAVQFTLATIGRTPAPRLVVALLGGVGLMGLVPVIVASRLADGPPEASTTVLALPFLLLFFFLLGLRLAVKTPVELAGRWLFDQTDVSPLAGRDAARRVLLALGVAPPVALTAVLWFGFWPADVALVRTLSAFAGGVLALEVMLYGFVGVPCARPAVAEAFKGRTIGLVVGFEVFCFESAAAQAGWQNDLWPVLFQAAFFAVAAAGVRIASDRAAAINAIVDEHVDPRLNLEIVGPMPGRTREAAVRPAEGSSHAG